MLVDYQFYCGGPLPEMPPCLYQYLAASNGVYVRAKRAGLEAIAWHSNLERPIEGLAPITPWARLTSGRAPRELAARMLEISRRAGDNEILFYLVPPMDGRNWRLVVPEQIIGAGSVRPVDPLNAWGQAALIEVHSHHGMQAYFSGIDNRDEATGFRLYGVLGNLHTRPTLRMRVGIYGHFQPITADSVFEIPDGLVDAVRYEQTMEARYAAGYDLRYALPGA